MHLHGLHAARDLTYVTLGVNAVPKPAAPTDAQLQAFVNENKAQLTLPEMRILTVVPFIIASWLTGHWSILAGATVASAGYYGAYEYMHWCMHLPKKRNIERSGIYFRLNGHHLLHHRYMHKNFNVVLPLADLILGTLILRSKIHFAQAQGPAVPNVQPRTPLAPKLEEAAASR